MDNQNDFNFDDLSIDELRRLEQQEAGAQPFAELIAAYYRTLVIGGVPPEHAIILANNYQAIYAHASIRSIQARMEKGEGKE